ncbi:MAG TPA: hypothetical protein VLR93_03360 [Patescibacteria group bacterium]|nr:hypothetical protein [Patescibacteria group bacterium]
MHTLDCPRCGRRPLDEFAFGGERRPVPDWIEDPDARNVDEVWMFENLSVRPSSAGSTRRAAGAG